MYTTCKRLRCFHIFYSGVFFFTECIVLTWSMQTIKKGGKRDKTHKFLNSTRNWTIAPQLFRISYNSYNSTIWAKIINVFPQNKYINKYEEKERSKLSLGQLDPDYAEGDSLSLSSV